MTICKTRNNFVCFVISDHDPDKKTALLSLFYRFFQSELSINIQDGSQFGQSSDRNRHSYTDRGGTDISPVHVRALLRFWILISRNAISCYTAFKCPKEKQTTRWITRANIVFRWAHQWNWDSLYCVHLAAGQNVTFPNRELKKCDNRLDNRAQLFWRSIA